MGTCQSYIIVVGSVFEVRDVESGVTSQIADIQQKTQYRETICLRTVHGVISLYVQGGDRRCLGGGHLFFYR